MNFDLNFCRNFLKGKIKIKPLKKIYNLKEKSRKAFKIQDKSLKIEF